MANHVRTCVIMIMEIWKKRVKKNELEYFHFILFLHVLSARERKLIVVNFFFHSRNENDKPRLIHGTDWGKGEWKSGEKWRDGKEEGGCGGEVEL